MSDGTGSNGPWTTIKSKARRLPGARRALRWLRRVPAPGGFRGVYATFAQAEASARGLRLGYDHEEFGSFYTERMGRVYASDYPALFWLKDALPTVRRVLDFGGHVGVAYYAYRRYVPFPDGLTWQVCDVGKVVEAGRRIAAERGAEGLRFCSALSESDACELFFSAGALQYLDTPFADMLRGLKQLPTHLVLNKLPLTDGAPFVTLQSTGPAYHPYQVFARSAFLASVESLGFQIVDTWENYDLHCHIDDHPERSLDHYCGLYATRDSAVSARPS